jgi:hypothetical protein
LIEKLVEALFLNREQAVVAAFRAMRRNMRAGESAFAQVRLGVGATLCVKTGSCVSMSVAKVMTWRSPRLSIVVTPGPPVAACSIAGSV